MFLYLDILSDIVFAIDVWLQFQFAVIADGIELDTKDEIGLPETPSLLTNQFQIISILPFSGIWWLFSPCLSSTILLWMLSMSLHSDL